MKKIKLFSFLLVMVSFSFTACDKNNEPEKDNGNNTVTNFWYKHEGKTYPLNVTAVSTSYVDSEKGQTSFGISLVDNALVSIDNMDFYFFSDKLTLSESKGTHSLTLCRLNMNKHNLLWTFGDPEKDLNITESKLDLSYSAGEYILQGYCVNQRNGKIEFHYKGSISSYNF